MGKTQIFLNDSLSTNFTMWEFVNSRTAQEKNIINVPNQKQVQAMRNLCARTLEPIRAALRKLYPYAVVSLTSGFRCPLLNKEVGGSRTSQHLKGEAGDIRSSTVTTDEFFAIISDPQNEIDFDQLIWEFGQWNHVSCKLVGKNRKMILYAWITPTGETVYTKTPPPNGWRSRVPKSKSGAGDMVDDIVNKLR